jgi:hypothetical protein
MRDEEMPAAGLFIRPYDVAGSPARHQDDHRRRHASALTRSYTHDTRRPRKPRSFPVWWFEVRKPSHRLNERVPAYAV